jgi:hypothetical protein
VDPDPDSEHWPTVTYPVAVLDVMQQPERPRYSHSQLQSIGCIALLVGYLKEMPNKETVPQVHC